MVVFAPRIVALAAMLLLSAAVGAAAQAQPAPHTLAPLAHVDADPSGQAAITAGGVRATVRTTHLAPCPSAMTLGDGEARVAQCDALVLSIDTAGRPASRFPLAVAGDLSALKLSLYRLDPAAALPQLMVSGYSGGAHCCENTTVFGQDPSGHWTVASLGGADSDEAPAVVEAGGQTALVTYDGRFLYTFASHAGSYTPIILQHWHPSGFDDVTRAPAFRGVLLADRRNRTVNWSTGGRHSEPNGFLAYDVATAANLGDAAGLDRAWRNMLAHQDKSREASSFGISMCDLHAAQNVLAPRNCSASDKRLLPFPTGLAAFLVRNGYLTPAQALALTQPQAAAQAPTGPAPTSSGTTGAATTSTPGHYRPDFPCDPPPTQNGVATMLCADSDAAKHELQFDQVYYALRQQVGKDGWAALRQQVVLDENDANRGCALPVPGATDQTVPQDGASCYIAAMDRLTDRYRQRLSGDALAESRRDIDLHLALQQRLVDLGYLPQDMVVDGVYGEATRAAITTWQRVAHRPASDGFISDADAEILRGTQDATPAPPVASAAAPTPAPAPAAAPVPAPAPSSEPTQHLPLLHRSVVAGALLVLAIGLMVFFRLRKRPKL